MSNMYGIYRLQNLMFAISIQTIKIKLKKLWFQLGGRGGGRVVHAEHHKFMSFDIKNINEVISFRIHLCKKKKKNQIFEV